MHSNIARCAMQSVWNRTPNPFQAELIPLILQMIANDKVPEPILLVQSTSSGKSSIPQTASVTTSGVTAIIERAQSSGSNQVSKIKHASKSNGPLFCALQLDMYKVNNNYSAFARRKLSAISEKNLQSTK